MKKTVFILGVILSYFTLQAQEVIATGVVAPDYDNRDAAWHAAELDAIKQYNSTYFSYFQTCLGDLDTDEDDYDVYLLEEKALEIDETALRAKGVFDVNAKKGVEDNLRETCRDKEASDAAQKAFEQSLSDGMSHFHLGVGAFGWPNVWGVETFFEFELDGISLYATYAQQTLEAKIHNGGDENYDMGTTRTVGGHLKIINLFLVGYEQVLSHDNFVETEATHAITWGLMHHLKDTQFEIGLLFKNFNDEASNHEASLSGGAVVRYKFF